jgi:hypothetical protein
VLIDIAFGDATEPDLEDTDLPVLLDFPAPHLRSYPRETVIAEKFQTMVMLGRANSRMKDYYDIWVLSHSYDSKATLWHGRSPPPSPGARRQSRSGGPTDSRKHSLKIQGRWRNGQPFRRTLWLTPVLSPVSSMILRTFLCHMQKRRARLVKSVWVQPLCWKLPASHRSSAPLRGERSARSAGGGRRAALKKLPPIRCKNITINHILT